MQQRTSKRGRSSRGEPQATVPTLDNAKNNIATSAWSSVHGPACVAMLVASLFGVIAFILLQGTAVTTSATASGGWLPSPEFEQEWGQIPCNIEDLRGKSPITAADFARFAALPQTPVIFRQDIPPAASQRLAREELLRLCGHVRVTLGSEGRLAVSGVGQHQAPLAQYLAYMRNDTSGELGKEELYLFESGDGQTFRRCAELGILPNPPVASTRRQLLFPTPEAFAEVGEQWWAGKGTDLRLSIGKAGSGLPFHQHAASYNWLIYGKKRWTLFPPNSTVGGGFNSISSAHLDWLKMEPRRWGFGDAVECVQNPGDVIFVPDGWHHGVVSLGETLGVARTGRWAANGTVWRSFQRAQFLTMEAEHRKDLNPAEVRDRLKQAEESAKEALRLANGVCAQCWNQLALVYTAMEEPDLEETAMRKAVEQNPGNAVFWRNYAGTLSERRKADEALKAVRKAQQLVGGEPGRGVELGQPLTLIAQQKTGKEQAALLAEAEKWKSAY